MRASCRQKPASGSCRITFASISSLSPIPDGELVSGTHALAADFMSSLQLGTAHHRVRIPSQSLVLAWIHAPGQPTSSPASTPSSSSSSSSSQDPPERRFPRPPWMKQPEAQAPSSSPKPSSSSSSSQPLPDRPVPTLNKLRLRRSGESFGDAPALCVESSSGRERVYCIRKGVQSGRPFEAFDMVDEPQTHQGRFMALVKSYLLPQGFPESVAPQYASYMGWRGVQYFFGGAMSVFTTKSLLGALGVAGRNSGEAAAAINWVLKDGAGRLGRFLFARWGRELDCELKQFRLAGDILMEAGAALELSTVLAPQAFLPLACTANLAKNLAAVAASSTRAPIYRTFALQNNLADVTAKGESVANLADIMGTFAGIMLSKVKLPLLPTFFVLSCGYLVASRMEVDSVELPYLNRARLAYTATRFLATGQVPGIPEANHQEPLLPWGRYHQGKVVLGARVEQACMAPTDLAHAAALFKNERFIMTYRPDTKKVYVLLKQGAQPTDSLKAAFSAHVFLHMLERQAAATAAAAAAGGSSSGSAASAGAAASSSSSGGGSAPQAAGGKRAAAPAAVSSGSSSSRGVTKAASEMSSSISSAATSAKETMKETMQRLVTVFQWNKDGTREGLQLLLEGSKAATDQLYQEFRRQADKGGWKLSSTMLNPGESRLLKVTPLAFA